MRNWCHIILALVVGSAAKAQVGPNIDELANPRRANATVNLEFEYGTFELTVANTAGI
mgnify:CR=1 FL=1